VSASKRRRVLDIIATDTTFVRADFRGREVWLGKCLHCNAHLMVDLSGEPISRATIEHIVPRVHGGTDALENLGLACARCNQGKGSRHDPRYLKDERAQKLVARLQERRRERWRPLDAPEQD
jgi:5-methylcytosine-specific restriction endonuclease McrA